VATLKTIFGEKTTTDMCNLWAKSIARPDRKTRDHGSILSEVIPDKQMRTDAHINTRRIFNGRIDTMTNDDNTIAIKVAAAANNHPNARALPGSKGKNNRPKGKVGWDELGGEHLHFTLYKENKDTMEVLYWIASQLKLHVKNFQFAGTKDRRGVTVQRVSAYRVAADRLHSVNSTLRQARIGGFKYHQQGLDLGHLYGNEFTITLRDCTFPGQQGDAAAQLEAAKQIVGHAVSQFQACGFINYYGLQRFGTFAISTDTLGRKMLRGDLESAVNDILSYNAEALAAAQKPHDSTKISADDIARAEALHIWETTKKSGAALDKLPRRFQAENALIRHLGSVDRKTGEMKHSKDWQGALQAIPRNLRLMYVHAYQSLVWNIVAGRRYELFGSKVVAGDLVLVHEQKDKEAYKQPDVEETIDDAGEIIVRPAAHDTATSLDDKFERARALTAEEASSGMYTIFDLVLPLPGFDVVYPPNQVGAFYTEYMGSEEGGKLNPRDMRRKWKDISLSGSYRKIMARPQGLDWQIKPYTRDDEQLVQTDLDKLIARAKEEGNADALGGAEALLGSDKSLDIDKTVIEDENMVDDDGDGGGGDGGNSEEQQQQQQQKLAVVIKMQLGSSQYATMALRELTKGGAVTFRPDFQGPR
jgi:tRNA pseudouridine13 synthase